MQAADQNKQQSNTSTAIIIGATGLVGRQLLIQLVLSGHYETVYAVVRHRFDIPAPNSAISACIVQWIEVADFSQLNATLSRLDLAGADAFSALGTTQKQAGSKAAFYQIDHDYNLAFAKIVKQQGAKHFLLVSAMGADAQSLIYYNRVKGELETDIENIGFAHFSIFRPSLLLGKRDHDNRIVESIAQKLFTASQKMLPATFSARPIEASRVARAMLQVAIQIAADRGHATPAGAEVEVYSNHAMLKAT